MKPSPAEFGPQSKSKEPFQFRLWQLMLLVTVCAIAAGGLRLIPPTMFKPLSEGILGVVLWSLFLCVLATPGYFLTLRLTKSRLWAFMAGIASLAMFFALLPSLEQSPTSVRRTYCGYNLKEIGLALQNYHDEHKSFPPAYVCDERGQPMHSWRVLILPYLRQDGRTDAEQLYKSYNFSEPWDGPNNIKLAPAITALYQCPEEAHSGASGVSYVAIVGRKTMWPGRKGIRWGDVKDGLSNTIMIVETTGSGIQGSEPRDLDYGQFPLQINSPAGGGIASLHGKSWRSDASCVQVLLGDGTMQELRNDLKPVTLKLLLEINDGQPMGEY